MKKNSNLLKTIIGHIAGKHLGYMIPKLIDYEFPTWLVTIGPLKILGKKGDIRAISTRIENMRELHIELSRIINEQYGPIWDLIQEEKKRNKTLDYLINQLETRYKASRPKMKFFTEENMLLLDSILYMLKGKEDKLPEDKYYMGLFAGETRKREGFKSTNNLRIDLDTGHENSPEWLQGLIEWTEGIKSLWNYKESKPALVVFSGRGYQIYFPLQEAIETVEDYYYYHSLLLENFVEVGLKRMAYDITKKVMEFFKYWESHMGELWAYDYEKLEELYGSEIFGKLIWYKDEKVTIFSPYVGGLWNKLGEWYRNKVEFKEINEEIYRALEGSVDKKAKDPVRITRLPYTVNPASMRVARIVLEKPVDKFPIIFMKKGWYWLKENRKKKEMQPIVPQPKTKAKVTVNPVKGKTRKRKKKKVKVDHSRRVLQLLDDLFEEEDKIATYEVIMQFRPLTEKEKYELKKLGYTKEIKEKRNYSYIKSNIRAHYYKGMRQNFIMGLAGYLSHIGYSYESALKIARIFTKGDEETEKREDAVRRTYEKGLGYIGGFNVWTDNNVVKVSYKKGQGLELQVKDIKEAKKAYAWLYRRYKIWWDEKENKGWPEPKEIIILLRKLKNEKDIEVWRKPHKKKELEKLSALLKLGFDIQNKGWIYQRVIGHTIAGVRRLIINIDINQINKRYMTWEEVKEWVEKKVGKGWKKVLRFLKEKEIIVVKKDKKRRKVYDLRRLYAMAIWIHMTADEEPTWKIIKCLKKKKVYGAMWRIPDKYREWLFNTVGSEKEVSLVFDYSYDEELLKMEKKMEEIRRQREEEEAALGYPDPRAVRILRKVLDNGP